MKNLMFSLVVMILIGSTAECATWQVMNTPTTEVLYDIWGTASDNIFAVGANGTILHFDGDEWTQMSSPTSEFLMGVWGSSADDIWAVGFYGITLHRQNGNNWGK